MAYCKVKTATARGVRGLTNSRNNSLRKLCNCRPIFSLGCFDGTYKTATAAVHGMPITK